MPRRDDRSGRAAKKLAWVPSDDVVIVGANNLIIKPSFIAPNASSGSQKIHVQNLTSTPVVFEVETNHTVPTVEYVSCSRGTRTATTWSDKTQIATRATVANFDANLAGAISDLTVINVVAYCTEDRVSNAMRMRGTGSIDCS